MIRASCARSPRSPLAAAQAEVPLEVCGEAASDPVSAPLLVGAGVDELSVGAARVGTLRDWVRALSFAETSELAAAAQAEQTPAGVEALVDPVRERLALLERSDANGEIVEGSIGIGSLGAEAQGGPAPGA